MAEYANLGHFQARVALLPSRLGRKRSGDAPVHTRDHICGRQYMGFDFDHKGHLVGAVCVSQDRDR
jgi:hypothetical protein